MLKKLWNYRSNSCCKPSSLRWLKASYSGVVSWLIKLKLG